MANFPSSVVLSEGRAYVLANGATHTQSVVQYDAATLANSHSLFGFRGRAPAAGKPGLSIPQQTFFQGLAAADGGGEQMRQEWIGSKGKASYERTMKYVRALARSHHAPLGHYVANDDGD